MLTFLQAICSVDSQSFFWPFCILRTHLIPYNIHFLKETCACVASVTLMFLHSETPENSGQVGDNIAKYNKVLADCNNSIWQYSGVQGSRKMES